MSTWTASPTRTFLNELLNLPKDVSKRVPRIVEILEKDPISAQGDAKKLKGSQLVTEMLTITHFSSFSLTKYECTPE